MIEKGKVLSIREGRATVALSPTQQCARCRLCSPRESGSNMSVELDAVEGLRPGHEVTIQIDSRGVLKGGCMVFILPLIAFIVGAAAAPELKRLLGVPISTNFASVALGGLLLALTFFGTYLRARSPKYQKKLAPKIIDFR